MCWVFQKKEGDCWVDVSSNYNDNDAYGALYGWLVEGLTGRGISGALTYPEPLSHARGFPADFEIVGESCHPIASNDIRSPADRNDPFFDDEPMDIFLGNYAFSWLYADEILNAPTPRALRRIAIPVEAYRQWDGVSLPTDWQPDYYLKFLEREDFARPENIMESTKFVVVEWNYDLTEDFRDFVDEVRRLKALHGEVRFVFGFC
jgi:hypothetical protein